MLNLEVDSSKAVYGEVSVKKKKSGIKKTIIREKLYFCIGRPYNRKIFGSNPYELHIGGT